MNERYHIELDELLPCPFCGMSNAQSLFPPTCNQNSPYDPADRAYPIIRCLGCFTEVAGHNWDESGKTAKYRWNQRNSAVIHPSDKY